MSDYYNGHSYQQGPNITMRNCTYKEINGLCIKTTTQNINRFINFGNVQNVDMRIHKTIDEEIHVNESSESESESESESDLDGDSKMHDSRKGKAARSKEIIAPSNSATVYDLALVPPDQFDAQKALAQFKAGNLGALAMPPAQRSSGASSSGYGGSTRRNAGSSSSVPPGSNESYQTLQSVPYIAAIQNLHEKGDFDWEEEANDDRVKGFTDALKDVVVKASEAGDGQHLISHGSRVLEHTMVHNGVPIYPNPRLQKVYGTYEFTSEETHYQYINSWNVTNVHSTEHTEKKSTTVHRKRRSDASK